MSHGLAIADSPQERLRWPEYFAPWGTENPRAVLRAFLRVAGSFGPLRERLRKGTEAAGAQLVA